MQWHTPYQVYPSQGHHNPLGEHLAEEDNLLGEPLAVGDNHLEDPQEVDPLEVDNHKQLHQRHQWHPLHHKPQTVDSVGRNPRSLTEIATRRTSSSIHLNYTGWPMH